MRKNPEGSAERGQSVADAQSKPVAALSASGLEADLAYFEARLELVREPRTANQKAQVTAFRYLETALGSLLEGMRRGGRGKA